MHYDGDVSTSRAFDLLERIASLMRAEQRKSGAALGLEPVHLNALAYLARANRYSDTPQAVGEYLGLTKGNVSQRLIWLEQNKLLRKEPDERDGRVVHLKLTAQGRNTLAKLHPPAIWRKGVPDGEALERVLEAALDGILTEGGRKTFGQCHSCRFHEKRESGAHCALLQVDLRADQIDKICREHEPAR